MESVTRSSGANFVQLSNGVRVKVKTDNDVYSVGKSPPLVVDGDHDVYCSISASSVEPVYVSKVTQTESSRLGSASRVRLYIDVSNYCSRCRMLRQESVDSVPSVVADFAL